MKSGLVLIALLAACGGGDRAIVVEVRPRETVHAVELLEVTVANEGSSQMETFDLAGVTLPATFSITTAGRTGPISITARGITAAATVAVGATTVDAADSDAVLMLDPADFVVNTEFAGSQSLNRDIETNGFQVTANGGVVTFGFRDDCPVSVCSQLGRRFDAAGEPLTTDLAAGTNQFRWNTVDGQFAATVGVASQPDGSSIALWDAPTGVACRAMSADGTAAPSVVTIAPDTDPDVVSAVPLITGNYAVTWAARPTTEQVIRGTVVSPTCTTVLSPFTVGTPVSFANRPAVGTTGDTTMIAWIEDFSEARFRLGSSAGAFGGPGQIGTLLVSTAPDPVDFVRIAAHDGVYFVLFNHGIQTDFTDALVLRRIDGAGARIGEDTILATQGVDFAAPAIAIRADGAVLAVWTQCDTGDGSGCAVLGRVVRPSGVPVGDSFVINTTTTDDQADASVAALDDGFVVAYTDASATAPDIDLTSVRARYVYPAFDDARFVIGAPCENPSQCGPGLVCGPDAGGTLFCHAACDATTPACAGGGTCTPDNYCQY